MKTFEAFTSTQIFPAIDLRGGRCVRLIRGARDAEIHYDDDPLAVARRWCAAGARCLHVIDLGAAFGEADSRAVILAIAREVDVPVQAGGGLRDEAALKQLLDGGVARVLLGTRALADRSFLESAIQAWGSERIVLCMDCDGERVKVSGWEEDSAFDIPAALTYAEECGANRFLVTATDRDGTLSGPRLDLTRRILDAGVGKVAAAGGVGRLEDVRALIDLAHPALEGVVVGRALYEGAVSVEDAVALTAP
jgi:phosphoribosylformimino-5-aminoimidazole carboxamide ribotide isomerase